MSNAIALIELTYQLQRVIGSSCSEIEDGRSKSACPNLDKNRPAQSEIKNPRISDLCTTPKE